MIDHLPIVLTAEDELVRRLIMNEHLGDAIPFEITEVDFGVPFHL